MTYGERKYEGYKRQKERDAQLITVDEALARFRVYEGRIAVIRKQEEKYREDKIAESAKSSVLAELARLLKQRK